MRSSSRSRLLTLVALAVLTILYLTSSARSTRDSPFYKNTVAALQKQQQQSAAETPPETVDVETKKKHLKEAEEQAKASADKKGDAMRKKLGMEKLEPAVQKPLADEDDEGETLSAKKPAAPADEDEDEEEEEPKKPTRKVTKPIRKKPIQGGRSVAGRKSMDEDSGVAVRPDAAIAQKLLDDDDATAETAEDHAVEEELNSILKRSPIIIFSKTTCPFSKKAKRILLDEYIIKPAPFVVELNEHDLGQELQAELAKSTGRKTVPNILINGKSIGGGDDIEELHESGKLISTVKSMGGKRIVQADAVGGDSDKQETKRRRARR